MKSQSTFEEKLNKIVSSEKSNWVEKAKWGKANKSWLLKSAAIALKISSSLKEKNDPGGSGAKIRIISPTRK